MGRVRNNRVLHTRNGPDYRSISQKEETGEQVAICTGGPGIDQCEHIDYVAEVDKEIVVAIFGKLHNSVSINYQEYL